MQNSEYFAIFYTEHLYYIPQFLPVARELEKRQYPYLFVVLESSKRDIFNQNESIINVCKKENIPFQVGEKGLENSTCEYLICGGDNYPDSNLPHKQKVLIVHGIGTKVSAFTEDKNKFDIRFVEGDFRLRRLKELYPDAKVIWENVGFSKLDDVFRYTREMKNELINNIGLDSTKPTLLYAPTFYPSSIENMSNTFPDEFKDYNIIIKPHYYSYLRKKYKTQRKKFKKWQQYKNVYFATFEDYNIAPFYAIADLLISDESSVVFEFAALDKPVICNRFIHLRLSYRIFGKYKFNKRMESAMNRFRDIGENVWKYKKLKSTVEQELNNPSHNHNKRVEYTKEIIGPNDGKVSVRMVDIMEKHYTK
ncbi:CDP-glycerol glycerophosphotransferase family protein [Plebeiibacterium marinum]|uniref:CDP-glycerol glycerophosphotransferase family protein n=1 Tax=Plebeiibacterium marinum TaxID=2992111 RepID=A0AAE3MEL5_9BACT|nr:CDP-glycerol glycerophosphotransferase family protein [Plebeiobacterium marinum]MCW3806398.1 CDP-glycerol glycerophosphotransferase family protein [Plebeiobacterium marinum]